MKKKRGISPLIATVLLIGFTIVLAALVMRWGSTMFRDVTIETGCESDAIVTCSQSVSIELTGATYDGTSKVGSISVVSNGDKDIDKFVVRVHDEDGAVVSQEDPTTLSAYGADTLNPTFTGGPVLTELDDCDSPAWCGVSVMPIITEQTDEGESCTVVCSQSEAKYAFGAGDVT